MSTYTPLRLKAEDEEDLKIFSTYLMGSICTAADFYYDKDKKTFLIHLNRYVWENRTEKGTCQDRVNASLQFEGVEKVKKIGDFFEPIAFLELLAIHLAPEGLCLTFAGNHKILLAAQEISCKLRDTGDPWHIDKERKYV